MYLLKQFLTQIHSQFALYDVSGGLTGNIAEDRTASNVSELGRARLSGDYEAFGRNATPEQLRQYIEDKTEELQALEGESQFISGWAQHLIGSLTSIAEGRVVGYGPNDPEYQRIRNELIPRLISIHSNTVRDIQRLRDEIYQALGDHIEQTLEPEVNIERDEAIVAEMRNISNERFLTEVPVANRLEYITNPPLALNQLEQDSRITFTFHNNRELYIQTTLGQATAGEARIRAFTDESGVVYQRRGLSGEFFSENGERLKIHEGTILQVSERVDDISDIEAEIEQKLEGFEGTDIQRKIAEEAQKKGYDHTFVLEAFSPVPDLLGEDGELGAGDRVRLEIFLTDLARAEERFIYHRENTEHEALTDDGRFTHYFASYFMQQHNSGRREEVMEAYGFTSEQIEETETYGVSEIRNFIPLEDFPELPDFDYTQYAGMIAERESNSNYRARNDAEGRRRGVERDRWAFGKYQFIIGTLRGLGVHLNDENDIQNFLNNPEQQEEIMRRFTLNHISIVMNNPQVMQLINTGQRSWGRTLAAMHFGGATGGLRHIIRGTDRSMTDWLGGSNYTRGFA